MPHWLFKSALQQAISRLPYRQRINHVFQRFVTKSLELGTGMFERSLEHCRTHLQHLYDQCPEVGEFTVVELGTGWIPTMPVGMYLCGASTVWTMDIDPMLHRRQLRRMMQLLCEYADRDELRKHLPRLRPERWAELRRLAPQLEEESPAEFLGRFNIRVMVRDAQQSGLAGGSVNLFYSTGVLEYIPRPVLQGILKEFRRLCASCAVMSHWISTIDQFSYFDRSITPFNYLRYTSKQWSYFNPPLIWQNRLRICDYRQLFVEAGFQIWKEKSEKGSPADLGSIQLAPEFSRYSQEDLLVLTAWLAASPRD